MGTIPFWLGLGLLVLMPMRSVVTVGFVLIVGIIQGLTTGHYPSLKQWATVLRDLQQPVGQETGSSSVQDDEPARPVRRRQSGRGNARRVPRRQ